MKRILTFLTLIAVSLVVSPRQSDAQQYAWVPVIANEPAPTLPQSPTAYSTSIGESYATSVADLAPPPDDFGDDGDWDSSCSKGKGTGGCGCPACRHRSWFAGRAYVGIEFLQWYNKGRDLPPLVTTGFPAAVTFPNAGVLPAAPIAFGGEVGDDLKAGGRITGGLWFDDCERTGAVVRAYGSEGDSTPFNAQSGGNPILAVPFNDRSAALFGQENALVLAYANGLTPVINAQGGVAARASNDVWGGDAFIRTNVDQNCNYRFDLLAGYQFTKIDDDVEFRTNLTRFDIAGDPTFTTSDLFDVSNQFHGGEFGLMGELYRGRLTLQMLGKIGVGNMNQKVTIAGSNTVNGLQNQGGIFAQTTAPNGGPPFNIGSYERNVLAWSPEASIKAIYCMSDRLSVTVGYTFLYWNRVALAGDQIDRRVNRDVLFGGNFQPGGGANPAFAFNDTDFWVQTIDIGLTLNY